MEKEVKGEYNMDFTLPVLIFCFFVFLFIVYILSHDDYVFLRKNISMEQVFNLSFLTGFFAIFFSRLLYVLSNPSIDYLNPLVFFLFTYFPGLSLAGAILGSLVFMLISNKKIPKSRLFDFFSIAFLGSSTLGFLIFKIINLLSDKLKNYYEFVIPFIYFVFFVVFIKILFPMQRKGELKDGTLGYLALSSFSVVTFLTNLWSQKNRIFFIFGVEDIFLAIIFIFSMILLSKQEKLFQKFKVIKK